MAVPSGNVAVSEKMQFPGGVGVGGSGEILHHHHHRQQWFPDERDSFISWLRGEFAAANAIIDSLCQHLRLIGDSGEYEGVIGSIQQRRCNWNTVLHMQQYFSVGDVAYALQQVAWRRKNRYFDPVKVPGKEFKRSGFGSRQGQRSEPVKDSHSYDVNSLGNSVDSDKGESVAEKGEEPKDDKGLTLADDKKDVVPKPQVDGSINTSSNLQVTMAGNSEPDGEGVEDGCASNSEGPSNVPLENDSHYKKHNLTVIPKSFVGTEIIEGKAVNVVEGMKLYDEMFDAAEVSKLVALVNDVRTAGRRGQFQGQTYVLSKRPMKGHGREMIQLGLHIADAPPDDENAAGTYKDRRIESIPELLQDVIERIVGMEILTVKPDSCIIDIFNEGDHSQPHMWPPWFRRPVCVLLLTECDMTFGRVIGIDHPGDYRGSLKLSLSPGSLLVMEGKSADLSKHAIPSLRKLRMLVTLTKSQPKKTSHGDNHRLLSPSVGMTSHWGPPPIRSPNHIRHPIPKHYGPVPTNGVLPAPSLRPQLAPPNGIQPIFIPAPVGPAMPFPAPVALPSASAGWSAGPPRHPPPRLPVPGTGVFLPPPGSGNSTQQLLPNTGNETNLSVETHSLPDKDGKPNGSASASPKDQVQEDRKTQEACNGSIDGAEGGKVVATEELQLSVDMKVESEPAGAI